MMIDSPALDVSSNVRLPPEWPVLTGERTSKLVSTPAVALFVKMIDPPPSEFSSAIRSCITPELFVVPVPLMVRKIPAGTVLTKGAAPEVKLMALTSVVSRDRDIRQIRGAKRAKSPAPFCFARPVSRSVPITVSGVEIPRCAAGVDVSRQDKAEDDKLFGYHGPVCLDECKLRHQHRQREIIARRFRRTSEEKCRTRNASARNGSADASAIS
jgi:hypothetical protein